MKAVIDSSALLSYFLKDKSYNVVREALLEGSYSTELAVSETLFSLINAWRKGVIEEKHLRNAVKAMFILSGSNIIFYPIKEVIESAVEISIKESISISDALYIAIASKLKIPILTTDAKIMNAARRNKVRTVELSDLV